MEEGMSKSKELASPLESPKILDLLCPIKELSLLIENQNWEEFRYRLIYYICFQKIENLQLLNKLKKKYTHPNVLSIIDNALNNLQVS